MTTDFVTPTTYTFGESKARATPRHDRPIPQATEEAPAFPTTPIYARTRKSSAMGGVSPASIIGGAIVVAVFAAGIFAISQTGSEPAALSEPTEIAAAPMAPAAPTPLDAGQPVVTEAESAAAEAAAQRAVTPADPAPAVKPAAKPAAVTARTTAAAPAATANATGESAQDAAAMLPDGPMPYVPEAEATGVVTPPPIVAPPAETQSPATAVGAETPMVPNVETTTVP